MSKTWTDKAEFLEMIETAENIEKKIVTGVTRVGNNFVEQYCVADELRNDKEVILAVTKKWKPGFGLASDTLKDDSAFCKEILIMEDRAGMICHMSDRIKEDPDMVKIALTGCGDALRNLGDKIKDDEEMVKTAVMQDTEALGYASERLRSKPEIFSIALDALLAQEGKQYELDALVKRAPENIKADKDLMRKVAVQGKCGRAINNMSQELRDDKDFVVEVLKASSKGYYPDCKKLSDRLRNDLDVMKLAVEMDPWSMRDAGNELKDNEALILHCVSIPDAPGCVRGEKIQFCSDRIRGDRAIALEVCKKSPFAFQKLSKELQDDVELLKIAVKEDTYAIERASDRITNDPAIMLDLLSVNMSCLQLVNNDMVRSEDFQAKVQALKDANQ
mmetsp:Transcript_6962/g.13805  ORF Transcript_6962/g.13805 Transcript_6962/m.13805 type:complete len:390 (-) Transcript_6962:139-1308(-)|eukprot:CAMPEP_0181309820 /NCGR_PEP_ID=MMETSP1101-20121128/12230_1 /TAXON_ID=46948 /ORGANISM="Rhodomonas abbreviata, Strain Caron Lab Isolate" /LENGTH=389 /DNA_ID=CAMNT_0023416355 /DNA_START=13 /DNA_END=1182 /DNA_ORIENTATION=+